ncbi:hypothetical protein Csa_020432, partial [Cucumis sativus]
MGNQREREDWELKVWIKERGRRPSFDFGGSKFGDPRGRQTLFGWDIEKKTR